MEILQQQRNKPSEVVIKKNIPPSFDNIEKETVKVRKKNITEIINLDNSESEEI